MLYITFIIGLIVIIFLVLCIMYDNNDSNSDIDIENKIQMLEIMNEAKNNAKDQIKKTHEKFNALTQTEANDYLNELNFFSDWVQKNTGNQGIMKQINELVKNANNTKIVNKKTLVDILTNIYSMSYIDFINYQNTEAYKVYAKYSNPRNNKYYTQFIGS